MVNDIHSFSRPVPRRDEGGEYFPTPSLKLPSEDKILRGLFSGRKSKDLGPNQLAWCEENIIGFKEAREATARIRNLYDESRKACGL